MMQVNMVTLTNLTHYYLRDMIQANYGKILNVSSTASFMSGQRLQSITYYNQNYRLVKYLIYLALKNLTHLSVHLAAEKVFRQARFDTKFNTSYWHLYRVSLAISFRMQLIRLVFVKQK